MWACGLVELWRLSCHNVGWISQSRRETRPHAAAQAMLVLMPASRMAVSLLLFVALSRGACTRGASRRFSESSFTFANRRTSCCPLLSSGTLCSAPAVWGNRHCHQDSDGHKPTNSHAAKDHRGEVPSVLLCTSYIDLDLIVDIVLRHASIFFVCCLHDLLVFFFLGESLQGHVLDPNRTCRIGRRAPPQRSNSGVHGGWGALLGV